MHKLIFVVLCFSACLFAQDAKTVQQADNYIYDGNTAFDQTDNAAAEKNYRRALALGEKSDIATYNMAATLQQDSYNEEALRAYEKVIKSSNERQKKHRSFHNIGNAMMEAKDYKRAVAAYMDALRNNPNDDETRYNYALAIKMLEDEEKQDEQDKQDNKDNQDKKDNQNDSQENKDNQGKEGDNNQDKNKDTNDKGENDKDKENGDQDQEKEGDKEKDKQPSQAQPTQLSPQQVQNLLEAMSNEEKKVQDKINAKKVKAAGTKSKKDW